MNEEAEKSQFIAALEATGRANVDKVIAGLEELGFFTAPASTRFHGSYPGGLLRHSLNVLSEARVIREAQIRLRPELAAKLPEDGVVIAALLHDVCKAEVYKKTEKFKRGANGWEKYSGYNVDYSDLPLGHGEKSVVRLLRWGLSLTDDEILAIRWHMHAFDMPSSNEASGCFSAATAKCPLLAVLIAADGLASRLLEK